MFSKKQREALEKGRRMSKGKPRLTTRGKGNSNWKGGIAKKRHIEMGRIEYKLWRTKVFTKDNYTCQFCKEVGVYLHADHIKSWATHPKLRYEINNGRSLCRMCHYKITFGKDMDKNSKWAHKTASGYVD